MTDSNIAPWVVMGCLLTIASVSSVLVAFTKGPNTPQTRIGLSVMAALFMFAGSVMVEVVQERSIKGAEIIEISAWWVTSIILFLAAFSGFVFLWRTQRHIHA